MKQVVSRASCRVDYSGGTVDLWPLYLYQNPLELVHMALNVFAESQISFSPTKKKSHSIHIESREMGVSKTYTSLNDLGDSLKLSPQRNPLRWVNRLIHHYLERSPKSFGEWKIYCKSDIPPGSGLGGSSVLGVSLASGLEQILNGKQKVSRDPWGLQQRVRDLESIEIEHPAGDQDYVPAIFGGLLIFKLGIQERSVEKLPQKTAASLAGRSALIYTGKPHHSGINNWQVFKSYHEGDRRVRESLKRIGEISSAIAQNLRDSNIDAVADLVNEEWRCRQKLSPAVQAEELQAAWDFARKGGAVAQKACGAGGGGCLLVIYPSQKQRDAAVLAPLPNPTWKWYPIEAVERGICVPKKN